MLARNKKKTLRKLQTTLRYLLIVTCFEIVT